MAKKDWNIGSSAPTATTQARSHIKDAGINMTKHYRIELTDGQIDLLIQALRNYRQMQVIKNNRIMAQACRALSFELSRALIT